MALHPMGPGPCLMHTTGRIAHDGVGRGDRKGRTGWEMLTILQFVVAPAALDGFRSTMVCIRNTPLSRRAWAVV